MIRYPNGSLYIEPTDPEYLETFRDRWGAGLSMTGSDAARMLRARDESQKDAAKKDQERKHLEQEKHQG